MDLVCQIRQEASNIADTMAIEILNKASKNLAHNRYVRLRRSLVSPSTQRERDYLTATYVYVKYKIMWQRLDYYHPKYSHPSQSKVENARDKWRSLMDLIEYGLGYTMPSIPMFDYTVDILQESQRGYEGKVMITERQKSDLLGALHNLVI